MNGQTYAVRKATCFAITLWLGACGGEAAQPPTSDAVVRDAAVGDAGDGGAVGLDVGVDGTTDANTDTNPGDGALADATVDAPPAPPPMPMNLNFDNAVLAAVHAGDAWYIGGRFVLAEMHNARQAIALDNNGRPSGCSVEDGFDGQVNSIAHIGDAIYLVGAFTTYRGQPARRIAKIDRNTCMLDTTFNPANADANGFNAEAHVVAVSADSVFVGGQFTSYRGVSGSANYLAKLDAATGALDTTFSPPGNNGMNGPVLALLTDESSVYVGGGFTDYRGVANAARYIARLSIGNGALDSTFGGTNAARGFDGQVFSLAKVGNALYVGGEFGRYGGVPFSAFRIAKLHSATGALDTTFSPPGIGQNGFNSTVYALATDGTSLFCGGTFQAYRGVDSSAMHVAKLNLTTGAIDTTFSPVGADANGFTQAVRALAVVDSSLIVGGGLGVYRGNAFANGIAKLSLTDGTIDRNYALMVGHDRPGFDRDRGAFALHAVGNTLWVGGNFTAMGGKIASGIARFPDATGTLDRTFSPAINGFLGEVHALWASETSLYVGGLFSRYRGIDNNARYLAKLDLRTGDIDATFSPPGPTSNGFNGTVYALTGDATSLYVGGEFTAYRGVANSANGIAKLDLVTGALDTTFSPPGATSNGFPNGEVHALARFGSALYVGGEFVSYRGLPEFSANFVAKLDASSGALDTTFSPPGEASNGTDGEVFALAVGSDGLYLGGDFEFYRGQQVNFLARVNPNTGALDSAFGMPGASAGFDDTVRALAFSSGALFVGGSFTQYRGAPASTSYVAKLNPVNGALDSAFTPMGATTPRMFTIVALAGYQDSIFVGGDFNTCEFGVCFRYANRANVNTRRRQ